MYNFGIHLEQMTMGGGKQLLIIIGITMSRLFVKYRYNIVNIKCDEDLIL